MAFPEAPLLFYPSVAKRYGVEAALLYGVCQQLMQETSFTSLMTDQTEPYFVISFARWAAMTGFWTEERLLELADYLSQQQLFNINIQEGDIKIIPLEYNSKTKKENPSVEVSSAESDREPLSTWNTSQPLSQVNNTSAMNLPNKSVEGTKPSQAIDNIQTLPVYDVPPPPPVRPLPKWQPEASHKLQNSTANSPKIDEKAVHAPAIIGSNALRNKGPAPSFGGSTGWKKRSNDAFQNLLERQEQLNKQLHSMTMDWKPSQMFYSSLVRSNIPQQYADNCLDEFILFYCDKNTKERSWDQKFLAWVKRGWVKQQANDNKTHSTTQNTGVNHENSQRDTREKRKRITAAIMDINDTNW